MYGRLIVIFLGMALFINSCNNLLSQWTGTYKLRVMPVLEAVSGGVGDAEYIQLEQVCPGPELHTWEEGRKWRDGIVYFPLKPCSQKAVQSSQTSEYQYIGWAYLPKDSIDTFYPRLPTGPIPVKGLIRKPPGPSRETVNQRYAEEKGKPVFLRVDAKPLHWGWHVAGMLLPALLIFWMESRSFNNNRKT